MRYRWMPVALLSVAAVCLLVGWARTSLSLARGSREDASPGATVKSARTLALGPNTRLAAARTQAGPDGAGGPLAGVYPRDITAFNQQVGTTSSAYLVDLLNAGSATLTISQITVTGNFTQSGGCVTSLAPGATCFIQVRFKPKSTGVLSGTLTITDNAPDSPQVLSLSGVGTSSAVTANPSSLSFAPQVVGTTSGVIALTLANSTGSTLTISSLATSGDFAQTNNCGTALIVASACLINVTFTPSSTGTRAGSVIISDSGSDSPQTLNLSGTGALSSISLSPPNLIFLNQQVGTTSSPLNVTVTNTGSTPLHVINITAGGDYAEADTCGNLAAGANCIISVTFTPSAKGTRTGHITLHDTDPTNLQSISLSGVGTILASSVAVSPRVASVTFTQTQQFQATINGVPSTAVTWSVDGITGGNSSVGTISAAGLYTPPAAPGHHTVTATSTSDPSQSASSPVVVTNYAGTFTYHNDNARTGRNLGEKVLTTGNVNAAQFGKLFSYPVDGKIYAQPLYVANVSIPAQGFHNVVYVATEHDSVYAFDADGRMSTPLWQDSFIDPSHGITTISIGTTSGLDIICDSMSPEVGITGTPVIDPTTDTLYVVARTKEVVGGVTNFVQRLHALDITTGAERPNSPVVIQASVPGTGVGTDGQGNVPLDGLKENQRSGLALFNGVVYITWAGFCDANPEHGWVIGYDGGTLQQLAVFNTAPNGQQAGTWHSGAAPAVDANGNIYFATGNGTFDANLGGSSYGSSIIKLFTSGSSASVADYFTPYNQNYLSSQRDLDLGSGGVVLLPDQPTSPTHLLIAGGKEGTLYLVDRDNMGQFNPSNNNQIVQCLYHGAGGPGPGDMGIWSKAAYYKGQIYYVGVNDYPKAFQLYNGLLSQTPVSSATQKFGYPGAVPTISANGSTNGVLWLVKEPTPTKGLAVLYAYDAANLANALYNSASRRDQGGLAVQFGVPTVANGKVYVGTASELDAFGLLP